MTSPPLNLAFGHTAGVGKDTLAALIIERGKHYRRALADALKEELGCALLSIDTRMTGNRRRGLELADSLKHLPVMRKLLQAYGDGKREMVAKTYWIDELFGYAALVDGGYGDERTSGLVVPDCRYLNEVQVFLEHKFLCIDIDRPDAPKLPEGLSAHVSETQLRPQDFPFQLVNDGTPEEMLALYDQIAHYYHWSGNPPRPRWPMRFFWNRDDDGPIAIHYAPRYVKGDPIAITARVTDRP